MFQTVSDCFRLFQTVQSLARMKRDEKGGKKEEKKEEK